MNLKEIAIAIGLFALAAWQFIWLPLSYGSYFFGLLFAGASCASFVKGLQPKKLTLEEKNKKKNRRQF